MQGMNDEHSFVDEKGILWNRIYTNPQAAISTKVDPFSQAAFVEKSKNMKGSVGDLWRASQEASEARAEKTGKPDEVKQAYFDNYSKKTKGKKSMHEAKENLKNLNITI